jgi:hypothetical protein
MVEFIQEFIGAKLIRIGNLEIWKKRVKMTSEFDFSSDIFGQNGNGPGVRARAAARVADILFQRLALVDGRARAGQAGWSRRSRRGWTCAVLRVAPAANDIFPVVAVRESMAGEILPKIPACGLAGVGKLILDGNAAK